MLASSWPAHSHYLFAIKALLKVDFLLTLRAAG